MTARLATGLALALLAAPAARADDDQLVFFTVVHDGGTQAELWTLHLDVGGSLAQVVSKLPISQGGLPAAGGNQSLVVDTSGTLWGDGTDNAGHGGRLFRWDLPPTSGAVVSAQALLIDAGGLVVPFGFAPDGQNDGRIFAARAPDGSTWSFDPPDVAGSVSVGGPVSGDARALAAFPGEDVLYSVEDANQLFAWDFSDAANTDHGSFDGGTYQNVRGLTAVAQDITNGGADTLYGLDHEFDVLLRIVTNPTPGQNDVTVIPLSETLPDGWTAQSLAYHTPCDGGAWTDCNDNDVPDACDVVAGVLDDCNGNGVADCCESWTDLGQGLAGTSGVPAFTATGLPSEGEAVGFSLSGAAALAPATLVLGVSAISAPFKGGVLVPAPDITITFGTNLFGSLELPLIWPAGIPVCAQLWLQWWIADGAGPQGYAASNAIVGLAQ